MNGNCEYNGWIFPNDPEKESSAISIKNPIIDIKRFSKDFDATDLIIPTEINYPLDPSDDSLPIMVSGAILMSISELNQDQIHTEFEGDYYQKTCNRYGNIFKRTFFDDFILVWGKINLDESQIFRQCEIIRSVEEDHVENLKLHLSIPNPFRIVVKSLKYNFFNLPYRIYNSPFHLYQPGDPCSSKQTPLYLLKSYMKAINVDLVIKNVQRSDLSYEEWIQIENNGLIYKKIILKEAFYDLSRGSRNARKAEQLVCLSFLNFHKKIFYPSWKILEKPFILENNKSEINTNIRKIWDDTPISKKISISALEKNVDSKHVWLKAIKQEGTGPYIGNGMVVKVIYIIEEFELNDSSTNDDDDEDVGSNSIIKTESIRPSSPFFRLLLSMKIGETSIFYINGLSLIKSRKLTNGPFLVFMSVPENPDISYENTILKPNTDIGNMRNIVHYHMKEGEKHFIQKQYKYSLEDYLIASMNIEGIKGTLKVADEIKSELQECHLKIASICLELDAEVLYPDYIKWGTNVSQAISRALKALEIKESNHARELVIKGFIRIDDFESSKEHFLKATNKDELKELEKQIEDGLSQDKNRLKKISRKIFRS